MALPEELQVGILRLLDPEDARAVAATCSAALKAALAAGLAIHAVVPCHEAGMEARGRLLDRAMRESASPAQLHVTVVNGTRGRRRCDASLRSRLAYVPDLPQLRAMSFNCALDELDLGWGDLAARFPSLQELHVSCDDDSCARLDFARLAQLQRLRLAGCHDAGMEARALAPGFRLGAALQHLHLRRLGAASLGSALDALPALRSLHLVDCAWLQSLPAAPRLTKLVVARCGMLTLDRVCASLLELRLEGSGLRVDADVWRQAPALQVLCARHAGVPPLRGPLAALRTLSLEGMVYSQFVLHCVNARHLPSLQSLTLGLASHTGFPTALSLSGLTTLTHLCLELAAFRPEHLLHMGSLRSLWLAQCRDAHGVQTLELPPLSAVTSLRVDGVPLVRGLRHLEGLRDCAALRVVAVPAGELLRDELHGLGSLTALDLSGNDLGELPPGAWSSWERLSSLRSLDLKCCRLRSVPPLPAMPDLTRLCLRGNLGLRQLGGGCLRQQAALRVLDASETAVRAVPAALGVALTALRELRLQDCGSLESIAALPPSLRVLDVRGCSSLRAKPQVARIRVMDDATDDDEEDGDE